MTNSTEIWVADDGSWGSGYCSIISTEKWSDDDWRVFEETTDWARLDAANEIASKYE
jgi:hypothetical protein